ncbi:hypothetical protein AVEN_36642-1 [Araneus ventricosus]|uniref:Uncharacterized protein n=1 Tax=Araneus ventricosus TaxID=182803 RepID=A0A4Y2FUU5_ARAVE|nr:hypothetical protein AVEN_36642-1 [Araneus ventricosus]
MPSGPVNPIDTPYGQYVYNYTHPRSLCALFPMDISHWNQDDFTETRTDVRSSMYPCESTVCTFFVRIPTDTYTYSNDREIFGFQDGDQHKEQKRRHASQIYCRIKEVYGEQCLARCYIFWWCQRYEVGRVNIKDLPHPVQAHVVTNSATISAADELIRQNRRITTREIAVKLSICKGTVHQTIHKKLGYGKFNAQWVSKYLSENQKTAGWELDPLVTQEFLH